MRCAYNSACIGGITNRRWGGQALSVHAFCIEHTADNAAVTAAVTAAAGAGAWAGARGVVRGGAVGLHLPTQRQLALKIHGLKRYVCM